MQVSLEQDHWVGSENRMTERMVDDVEDIHSALAALDGMERTQVTLYSPDGRMLAVGGGPSRYLVQYLLPEDQGEWLLVNETETEGETELAIGRQLAPYRNKVLVNIDQLKPAVSKFCESGTRSELFTWEQSY